MRQDSREEGIALAHAVLEFSRCPDDRIDLPPQLRLNLGNPRGEPSQSRFPHNHEINVALGSGGSRGDRTEDEGEERPRIIQGGAEDRDNAGGLEDDFPDRRE